MASSIDRKTLYNENKNKEGVYYEREETVEKGTIKGKLEKIDARVAEIVSSSNDESP